MRPRTGDSSEAVISWAWIPHPAPAPASGTMETAPPARGAQAPNPNQTPLPRTHAQRPAATPGTSIPPLLPLPAQVMEPQSPTAPPRAVLGVHQPQSQAGRSPAGQGTHSASPCGTAEPWVTHPGTSRISATAGIARHGDTAWLGQFCWAQPCPDVPTAPWGSLGCLCHPQATCHTQPQHRWASCFPDIPDIQECIPTSLPGLRDGGTGTLALQPRRGAGG